MGSSGAQVDMPLEAVRHHAGSVDGVSDGVRTAYQAANQVFLDVAAFGMLCSFVPALFDPVLRGTVEAIVDDGHVLVTGVNQAKRHTRPNPMKNQPGGIVAKTMPIDVSNIAIWNPVTQKADRVGMRVLEDGRKVRFFKSNGETVDA